MPPIKHPEGMGIFKSLKMGCYFQFPIGHDYLTILKALESNAGVLEFYPARSSILRDIEDNVNKLEQYSASECIVTERGKHKSLDIIPVECPTFFVVRRDAVGYMTWVSWQSRMRIQSRRCWRPPTARWRRRLGFYLWYRALFPSIQRIDRFLETYLRADRTPVSFETASMLLEYAFDQVTISLRQLCEAVEASIDDGYFLLAIDLFAISIPPGDVTDPDDVICLCFVPNVFWNKHRYLCQYLLDSPY